MKRSPLPFLDKEGAVVYKDSNMPTGKPAPSNIHKIKKAIFILLIAKTGGLYPVTGVELKKEYGRWVRRTWTTENGLPQDTVYTLTQAGDGCLWIGSNGGLARFDGSVFTIFKKNNTLGLGSDWITALCPDRDGSLWIGTYGGGLVNYREGKFSHISGLDSDLVWTIC